MKTNVRRRLFFRLLDSSRHATLSFLFPDACLACNAALGGDQRHLCDACRLAVVPRRGTILLSPESPVPLIQYALDFEGPISAMLRALKYGGRTSVARELALAALPMARTMAIDGVDLIVPVPLHPVRHRERGFNQSELIARCLAEELGLPCARPLERTRATTSQTGLSRRDRARNVEGAFARCRSVDGAGVLVVDDVATTGATLAAAAAALTSRDNVVLTLAVAGRRLRSGSDDL